MKHAQIRANLQMVADGVLIAKVDCIPLVTVIFDDTVLFEIVQAESSLIALTSRSKTQTVIIDHGIPEDQILPVCISRITAEIEWCASEVCQLLIVKCLELFGIRNLYLVGKFLNPVIRAEIDIRLPL